LNESIEENQGEIDESIEDKLDELEDLLSEDNVDIPETEG